MHSALAYLSPRQHMKFITAAKPTSTSPNEL
jgi:hypothetical protein